MTETLKVAMPAPGSLLEELVRRTPVLGLQGPIPHPAYVQKATLLCDLLKHKVSSMVSCPPVVLPLAPP